jgi:hypothetical protein
MNDKRLRHLRLAKEGLNREHNAAATIARHWRENLQHRTLKALIKRFDDFQVSVDIFERLGAAGTTHAIHQKDFNKAAFHLLRRMNWTINLLEAIDKPSHQGILEITPNYTKIFFRAILFVGHTESSNSPLVLDSRSAVECFFKILDELRAKEYTLHRIDKRLRKDFTPVLIKYYGTFLKWQIPDATALARKIIEALRDLYYAKCKVHWRLQKELLSECHLQIHKLRMKFTELNVPDLSLDPLDAEVRTMKPVWEAKFASEKAVQTIWYYWTNLFKHNTLWLLIDRARQLKITLEDTKHMR